MSILTWALISVILFAVLAALRNMANMRRMADKVMREKAPEENATHFPPDAPEGYEWRRATRWEAEGPEWYLSSVESCSMVDKENAQ